MPGSGRDIAILNFKNNAGNLIEPPKFLKIYEELNKKSEATLFIQIIIKLEL